MSLAAAISARLIPGRLALTSGRSIALFRMSPRSPPVSVHTRTSTPSRTYLAIVAAPLLDSSSGWACTAISRSGPAPPQASVGAGTRSGSVCAGAEAWLRLAVDILRIPLDAAWIGVNAPSQNASRRHRHSSAAFAIPLSSCRLVAAYLGGLPAVQTRAFRPTEHGDNRESVRKNYLTC